MAIGVYTRHHHTHCIATNSYGAQFSHFHTFKDWYIRVDLRKNIMHAKYLYSLISPSPQGSAEYTIDPTTKRA